MNTFFNESQCNSTKHLLLFNMLFIQLSRCKNWRISENTWISSRYGAEICQSKGVNFRNIHITPEICPTFKLQNVNNFELTNFYCPDTLTRVVKISGNSANNHIPQNVDNQIKKLTSR